MRFWAVLRYHRSCPQSHRYIPWHNICDALPRLYDGWFPDRDGEWSSLPGPCPGDGPRYESESPTRSCVWPIPAHRGFPAFPADGEGRFPFPAPGQCPSCSVPALPASQVLWAAASDTSSAPALTHLPRPRSHPHRRLIYTVLWPSLPSCRMSDCMFPADRPDDRSRHAAAWPLLFSPR